MRPLDLRTGLAGGQAGGRAPGPGTCCGHRRGPPRPLLAVPLLGTVPGGRGPGPPTSAGDPGPCCSPHGVTLSHVPTAPPASPQSSTVSPGVPTVSRCRTVSPSVPSASPQRVADISSVVTSGSPSPWASTPRAHSACRARAVPHHWGARGLPPRPAGCGRRNDPALGRRTHSGRGQTADDTGPSVRPGQPEPGADGGLSHSQVLCRPHPPLSPTPGFLPLRGPLPSPSWPRWPGQVSPQGQPGLVWTVRFLGGGSTRRPPRTVDT